MQFLSLTVINLEFREKGDKMICLNCNHMENMDYIRGVGICAVLEGETVILDEECICPEDILESTERLLEQKKGLWWLSNFYERNVVKNQNKVEIVVKGLLKNTKI